jgi:hypothetical protein
MNTQHLLATSDAKQNEPFVYYSGAAWDKAGIITSAQEWFEYLHLFRERLSHPLKISIIKRQ